MAYNNTREYFGFLDTLQNSTNSSNTLLNQMKDFNGTIYKADLDDIYSKPMLVIGVYIAVASLVCVIAMGVDLLHGFKVKKLWFPCKWFTINAFYLCVIAVAMKLPVDLSGMMPGKVDQVAKLGSVAFMCTMMANFLPSLATMNSNELLTNITALGVLVITLVVNVCIQIITGVVSSFGTTLTEDDLFKIAASGYNPPDLNVFLGNSYSLIATIYVAMLLLLLIIYVSSSCAILQSKRIIESKYQEAHDQTTSKDVQQSVEKLQELVSRYWIMAASGSPQFIIACAPTTTASGVICFLTAILHTITMCFTIKYMGGEYDSDYKGSTLAILIVQFIGVVVGTIAPLVRCFTSLSFKVTFKVILNHINVFNVESYWTQKLSDWKHKRLPIRFRSVNRKVFLNTSKSLVLNLCIILQKVVVILCKIIALVPFIIMICVLCLRWLLRVVFCSSEEGIKNLKESKHVLLLEDDVELAGSTLELLLQSLNRQILNSEKKQPHNLMNLIKENSPIGFQGVKMFDNIDHPDCWSLAVVTLTTIAVTLRKIKKVEVDSLMKSVREGLEYVIHVEENLNPTDENARIQKAALRLWHEVNTHHKWLGIKLKDIASQVKPDANEEDIASQFLEEVQSKKTKDNKSDKGVGTKDSGRPNGDTEFMSLCVKSMDSIRKTLIDDHKIKESHKKSFDELISSRIADIFAACLTNLPEVIANKCHTEAIEKREATVQAAAKLLGETKQIINILPDQNVPSKDDRPFINKWGAYLSEP